ncbi:MAG: FHA domain-containing protein, partial [Deltaproteobacteria bacterium]|nr:FHA domain-containing protein [Deltaproteobacteria bacterium]
LSLPRVEPKAGSPDTLQVSVVPMKAATAADGASVPRTLQIVAIPNGRELPSGKGLLSVLERINAAENAKAEKLGVEPNLWFGKDNVILPNPAKGGTVLTTREVSEILTSPELGLFRAETNVLPMKKPAGGEKTVVEKKLPKVSDEEVTVPGKKIPAPEKVESSDEATVPGVKGPLAARKGATAKPLDGAPKLDRVEGPTPLSPKDGVAVPEVEIRSDGESNVLSFEAGKMLPLGVQGGKLVLGEKAKSPLAEVEAMWTPEGEIGFYLRRSGKPERQRLRPGDKVSLGETSFVWEGERSDGRPKLKLVSREPTEKLAGPAAKPAKGEAPGEPLASPYDLVVQRGRSENSSLLKLVESGDGLAKGEGVAWVSSFANLSVPNQAHVPVAGSWTHLTRAEYEFARSEGKLKDTPSSTYEVRIRGEQRLADIEARLQQAYGSRLTKLKTSGSSSEWLLRAENGDAQVHIVLQRKDLPVPGPKEAREAFASFEGEALRTLTEWAKEQGTIRGLYAYRMLHLIGVEADGKGGTRFGTRFTETLHRYEKASDPAEKARAGEELGTMLAYLRDGATLIPEFRLLQEVQDLNATARPAKAVFWAKQQPGELGERGKKAEEAYLSLREKAERVRMLGEELRREIPLDKQKEGQVVYDEYLQAQKELDGAVREIRALEAKVAESGVNLDQFTPPKAALVEPPAPGEKAEVSEPTKKFGPPAPPAAAAPTGLAAKIGLSTVEIDAHAFLDFYFGEGGSIANIQALAKRSAGGGRDAYGDMAVDFQMALESFRAKVERYDGLEKTFEARRKEFHAAEGKDPAKAAEAKRLAEAAVKERAELQVEIERDLARLKAEPYNRLELRYNERIEKTEKETIPLDFALAAAEVEATVAVRGTAERPDLQYNFVYKPLPEVSEKHLDSEFAKLPLGEFVRAEVRVTRWAAADRAVDQMIEEGVLRSDQRPDFAALAASGAKEVTIKAEIPGIGEVPVVFRFEGKTETPVGPGAKGSTVGKSQATAAAMFLGLTTLLTPELAHAADKTATDGSILPWMLGAGAALVAAGVGAYMLWAKGRSGGTSAPPIRQRRGTGAEKIPSTKPLVTEPPPPTTKLSPVPAAPVEAKVPEPKPVPGPVKLVLQDNVPGKGREGSFGSAAPTPEYGSFSVRTGEGIGYKKHHNEDGFVQGRNWGLVLDGMGGMGSGDKASEVAGKKFAEEMALHGDMARAMKAAGDAVNASPYASGGAVAVAHQIIPLPGGGHVARIVHVGDAGAIVFRKNAQGEFELIHRTEEQSMAAEARRGGMLRDTLQMRASDFANIVSGGLGTGKQANPVVKDVPIREGDVILSFSDGVGDNVSRAELSQILKSSRSAEEVQAKVWELVHWKMRRLALVKDIFRGDAKSGGAIRDFVDAEGNARKGVELDESPGFFIDRKGHVYDSNGVLVDHYKADNVTIHAYVHDVARSKDSPVSEKTLVMPALRPATVDPAEAKTQIFQIPQPWTAPTGEWILPKRFGSALVGRDGSQGVKIRLGLEDVSSRHAEFFEAEGEVWIRDRGSLNGTWLNGRRLQGDEGHALSAGDIVTFGTRNYHVKTTSGGEISLTPALIVSFQQPGFQWGSVTVYRAETGAYAIRNDGDPNLLVGGEPLPPDGNAYRIRDRETVQIDGQNFVFREFP